MTPQKADRHSPRVQWRVSRDTRISDTMRAFPGSRTNRPVCAIMAATRTASAIWLPAGVMGPGAGLAVLVASDSVARSVQLRTSYVEYEL
jgi:hypothetical protein